MPLHGMSKFKLVSPLIGFSGGVLSLQPNPPSPPNVLLSPAKAWLIMFCWARAFWGWITTHKSHLVTTGIPNVLLPVVLVSIFNATLLALDVPIHLKPPVMTALFHKDLTGKMNSNCPRIVAVICVVLCSQVTSPHEMRAQRNGSRKDGTTGRVRASKSGESRHAVHGKMASSWGSLVAAVHISRNIDGGVWQ